jgi:hypothetical protein
MKKSTVKETRRKGRMVFGIDVKVRRMLLW